MKVAVIYNICGISGRENVGYYEGAIESLLNQDMDDFKVFVSSCYSGFDTRQRLKSYFGGKVGFNWISDKVPLMVSFNHTVEQILKTYDPPDAYLYVDSGVTFGQEKHGLRLMWDLHKSGPYAMTACEMDTDMGYTWWGLDVPRGTDFVMPVGKAINLHCQLFDHELYRFYGRIMQDVFASDRSESIQTFTCAGIRKRLMLTSRLRLHHHHSMDGASSGYQGRLWFNWPKDIDSVYQEGRRWGFGYEECDPQKRWLHDPGCYDKDGNAVFPWELATFIKNNMYLKPENFDYSKINYVWEP